MTRTERDEKHAQVITDLVASMCAHQAIFWREVDFAACEMSEAEASAIDLTAVMDFAAISLEQVGPLTKEEWLEFCETIYEKAEYAKVEVTTSEVGDA